LPPMAPIGPHVQNTMGQYQDQLQNVDNETFPGPGPQAPPEPQTKSTQRPKLKVKIAPTPTKQITVTEEGSPLSSELVRGSTPEGEDVKARAARYRAQLTGSQQKVVSVAMTGAGYDVETHGIRPPRHGCKLFGMRT